MNIKLVLLLCFVSVALAGRYWDQWAAGNGGVHSNPVFKTKPQIRWTFDYNFTYTDAVLPVDNQERVIYMANGQGGCTGYWKFDWSGQILSSWKTDRITLFDGTIGARNGVVYIYSGPSRTLFAVNETTTKVIWNATNLVTTTISYSNSPLEWNEDDSILYISTANQIHAINAANGNIIWSTQPAAERTYVAPLIRSTLDNTFVVKYYNNSIVKYNITTGNIVWTTQLEGDSWITPSPPTIDNADGSIYVTTFIDGVYKLDKNGNIVWSNNDFSGWFHYYSPILFNDEYLLAVGLIGGMRLYKRSTGESREVFKYPYNQQNSIGMQVWTQPLLNREKNVLYIVYFAGSFVALDTSDMFNFTVLWSLDTTLTKTNGHGPSIGSDGTIFLATSMHDWPVGLVSIGCPVTKQVSSDGMTCVCNPAFVTSGDSCVCSENTKMPSEDGFSCVDKPIEPHSQSSPSSAVPSANSPSSNQTPSATNSPSQTNSPSVNNAPSSSITSNAVLVSLSLVSFGIAFVTTLL